MFFAKLKRFAAILYFSAAFMLMLSVQASAYIDPATTSYIVQMIAGLFITVGVLLGVFKVKIFSFFRNFRVRMLELRYTKNENGFKTKLKALFTDQRTAKNRLLPALCVSFALPFTLVFFGFIDMYIQNIDLAPFNLMVIFLPVICITLVSFTALFLILIILRGKVYNFVISLLMGLLIAFYAQALFLNNNFQLTGDQLHIDTNSSIINLLIWFLIILLPFIVCYFWKRIWKFSLCFISLLLVAIQSIGLGFSIYEENAFEDKTKFYYLSDDMQFEVSSKDNVLIFILDRFDLEYVEFIKQDDPTFFDKFDGFTLFDNNLSAWTRTYPSATALYTGIDTTYDVPAEKYFETSWNETKFIPKLRESNFMTKLYLCEYYSYSDAKQLLNVADNVKSSDVVYDMSRILNNLARLSLCRYTPDTMKQLYAYSDGFNRVAKTKQGSMYKPDDVHYYNKLKKQGLTVVDDKNNFMIVHLDGSHTPYYMDENGNRHLDKNGNVIRTSVERQTKGNFNMIYDYIKNLKKLDLYENSTIIITGDHGLSDDHAGLIRPTLTSLFVKMKGDSGFSMKTNSAPVSYLNFYPTIFQSLGMDYKEYGQSYFDIPEDSDIIRTYRYRITGNPDYFDIFEVIGDAKDIDNWKKIGEEPLKYKHG